MLVCTDRDHVDPVLRNAQLEQPLAARLVVHDDRIDELEQPSLRGKLPPTWIAGQDVVRGENGGRPARPQENIELLYREPLKVKDLSELDSERAPACRSHAETAEPRRSRLDPEGPSRWR